MLAIVGLTHLEHREWQLAVQAVDEILLAAPDLGGAHLCGEHHDQVPVEALIHATRKFQVVVGERELLAHFDVTVQIRDHLGNELL